MYQHSVEAFNGIWENMRSFHELCSIISIQTDYETDIVDYEVLIYALTALNGHQSSNHLKESVILTVFFSRLNMRLELSLKSLKITNMSM